LKEDSTFKLNAFTLAASTRQSKLAVLPRTAIQFGSPVSDWREENRRVSQSRGIIPLGSLNSPFQTIPKVLRVANSSISTYYYHPNSQLLKQSRTRKISVFVCCCAVISFVIPIQK
jgi:hypothetical protein